MATTPSDTLRETIKASGETLYKVAKGAGVTWNLVKRFSEGGDIRTDQFDKLAAYFGAQLTLPGPTKKAKKK